VSAARRKGTSAETAAVDYLRGQGFPHAERRALGGNKDRGDIAGIIGTVIEVKNCKTLDLAGWLRELEAEMANDGAVYGAVVHKRRGTSDVGRWYATMPVSALVVLLRAALDADEAAA
jgi:hypothetical protein